MGAFTWLKILLERYHVTVFTNEASTIGIREYYKENLPENLVIHSFEDDNLLKRKFKIQLYFGYFTFNNCIKKYVKNNPTAFDDVQLVLHKNPTSFRYFTSLYKLNKPLVIGPIGGGLQVPKVLKTYFKSEPFINKLRIFDPWLLRLPAYRKQYQKADKILITLDYVKESLPKKFSDKIITLFDTGIDMENECVQKNKENDSVIKILWVGKLIRYKGAELAIKATNLLNDPNVHLDIIGDGIELKYLQNLVSTLKIEHQVTFHGNVPYTKVDDFYKNAHIFCFPTMTEASGNVILEAMKYSLPIVTIDNGGPKYMCPDSGTFKVPISNVENIIAQLSEKLAVLIASPALREKMGRENYLYCKENFSWKQMKKKIFAFIDGYQMHQKQ